MAQETPPNIVIILADDLGYGDVACYGAKDMQTPVLDRLAKEGMKFTSFYASASVCTPTRASLLTGLFPDKAGTPGVVRTNPIHNWGYFNTSAVTLPEALKPAGYHTALVGKWHLGIEAPNLPNERGFDFFHGFLGDMMDDYYTHLRTKVNYLRKNKETITAQGHATDVFTDWAIDYANSRKGKKEPFFLYFAYTAPHDPIQPPEDWLAKVKEREPKMKKKRRKLVALIEHMDANIGRFVEALKANGQWENTLFIFTSDNGGAPWHGANNGAHRGTKGSLWEGGHKVPTIAVWPGEIKPGSESDFVAATMDLFPTALEAAGAKPVEGIDAESILQELTQGDQPDLERDLIWVRREGGKRFKGQAAYALRRGDWKVVQENPYTTYKLYNLKSDPLEEKDVAEQQPELMKELTYALETHIRVTGRVPWQPPN